MRAVRVVMVIAVWLALWSDVSAANVLSGGVVAVVIVGLFDTWHTGTFVLRPLCAVRFALHFLYKLVQSTLVVARTVATPNHRIHTGIIAVDLHGCSDALVTLIAGAISLTPGTLTIEVRREPLRLFIHALDIRDVEQVQADVRALEVLAVRAFGDREAVAGLTVDDTTSWRGR